MKKVFLMSFVLLYGLIINAQEISVSKPIEVFYKSGDQVIQTLGESDGVVFMFQDERYDHIDAIESVNFENKEKMLYFFKKLEEVQLAPKTEKSVDVSVVMNEYVLNKKEVRIVRYGNKQFVTNVYVGKAYTIIPKTYLKKLMKKISE